MGRLVCVFLCLVMLAAPAWAELEIIVIPDTTEIQPYNERFHAAVPVDSANWQDSAFLAMGRKLLGKAAGIAGIVYSLESARQEVALQLQDGSLRIDQGDPFTYETLVDLIAGDHGIDTAGPVVDESFDLSSSSGTREQLVGADVGDTFLCSYKGGYITLTSLYGNMSGAYHSLGFYSFLSGDRISIHHDPDNLDKSKWFYYTVSSSVETAFDPADHPDVFGDDVIADNADDSLRQRMEQLYATAIPFDGVGRPDYGPVFDIDAVSDLDGDGHVEGITGSTYIDLPDGIADAFDSSSSVPDLDPSSISGMKIEVSDTGATALLSTQDAAILEAAGVPSDAVVTRFDPKTGRVEYRDSSGNSYVKHLSSGQMASLTPNLGSKVGTSTVSGTPFADQDIDYDAPDLDESIPLFDATVEAPEKKAIPLHDWVQSIPFAGLLASTSLDVGSGSSVVETDLTLLGQTGHISFDFSDYSSLFSVMGNIIFAIASFLALRMALVKK